LDLEQAFEDEDVRMSGGAAMEEVIEVEEEDERSSLPPRTLR